jgi:hypothetical protein
MTTDRESRSAPESRVAEVGEPFSYTPSETQFHDAATLLLAVYAVLWDEQSLAAAVPWAEAMVRAVDTDSTWANGRHDGDCTKVAMSCGRCMMDDFLNEAHHYFDFPPEPVTSFTWRTEALSTVDAKRPTPTCSLNAFGSTVHEYPEGAPLGTRCHCGMTAWNGGLVDA